MKLIRIINSIFIITNLLFYSYMAGTAIKSKMQFGHIINYQTDRVNHLEDSFFYKYGFIIIDPMIYCVTIWLVFFVATGILVKHGARNILSFISIALFFAFWLILIIVDPFGIMAYLAD